MRVCTTLLATLFCTCLYVSTAWAATPNDYWLPYATDIDAGSGQNGDILGITMVKSARFGVTSRLVANGVPVHLPSVAYEGDASNNKVVNPRPRWLVWAQNNRWKRATLRAGASPAITNVSSESAASNACWSRIVSRNHLNAAQSALIYVMPGADAKCETTDDIVRFVNLNDGGAAAPHDLPVRSATVDILPIYRVNGRLHYMLGFDGDQLIRFDPDLVGATVLTSGISSTTFYYGEPGAGTPVVVDGKLKVVRPNGSLRNKALKKPSTGYSIGDVWTVKIGGSWKAFFTERADSTSTNIQTRFFSVPLDGSATATRLAISKLPAYIQSYTPTQLIYAQGGAFDPSGASPPKLFALPLDGSGGPTLIRKSPNQGIAPLLTVACTIGEELRINESWTEYNFPDISTHSVAMEYLSDGTKLAGHKNGSQWMPCTAAPDGGEPKQLLARNGNGSVTPGYATFGARLDAVDPDGTMTRLTRLPDDIGIIYGGGGWSRGGTLGSALYNGSGMPAADVFAVDLYGNRFRLLTHATAELEFPIY